MQPVIVAKILNGTSAPPTGLSPIERKKKNQILILK